MLYLQTEDGRVHSVWTQVVLRSFPRHLCTQGTIMSTDEVFSVLQPTRLYSTQGLL